MLLLPLFQEKLVLDKRRTQPRFFVVLSRISKACVSSVDLPMRVANERAVDSGNSVFIERASLHF